MKEPTCSPEDPVRPEPRYSRPWPPLRRRRSSGWARGYPPTRRPAGPSVPLVERALGHCFDPGLGLRLARYHGSLEIERISLRLETVLQVVDSVHGAGVLEDLLSDLDGPPNRLHAFFASHLAQGGRHVTMNFDTCIERAAPAGPTSHSPSTSTVGSEKRHWVRRWRGSKRVSPRRPATASSNHFWIPRSPRSSSSDTAVRTSSTSIRFSPACHRARWKVERCCGSATGVTRPDSATAKATSTPKISTPCVVTSRPSGPAVTRPAPPSWPDPGSSLFESFMRRPANCRSPIVNACGCTWHQRCRGCPGDHGG